MQLFHSKQLILTFLVVSSVVFCQDAIAQSGNDKKKTTIRIQATEDKNGKVKKIEKKYEVSQMTDEERKQFVDKALDSLKISKENRRSVTITMDDGEDGSTVITKKRRKVNVDNPDDPDATAFSWSDDFAENFNTEKFRSHMRNFEREFKPRARVIVRDMEDLGDRMGKFWSNEVMKPSSVRDLNVYPNNPDNGVLNLRFQAPQKGDVSIVVTDTKGKEVGKKEIKDFSGNFVGQVDIRKNTKGTLFVTVVQNEDGATRRIVVP
jgi:hypothetical protein